MTMKRELLLLAAMGCLLAAPATADVVHLKDGRRLEGKVTDLGDKVRLKTRFGAAVLSKDEIDRIEMDADPAADYRAKSAGLAEADVEGHYALGLWCKQQKLAEQARKEFTAAVKADPDHSGARAELGYMKLRGRWTLETDVLRSARALQKIGQLDRCVVMLKPLTTSRDVQGAKKDGSLLLATVYEQLGDWSGALEQYESLQSLTLTKGEEVLIGARKEIIEKHPDGEYLVGEGSGAAVEPGLQPLAHPAVMGVALEDKAKEALARGRGIYERARRVDVANPGDAIEIFREADRHFVKANILCPDIARAYRVEVARKLIAVHEREFGRCLAKLVGTPAPSISYYPRSGRFTKASRGKWRAYIGKLEGYVKRSEAELQLMLELAQPYPDELSELISMAKKCSTDLERQRTFLRAQRKREHIKR